MGLKQEPPSPDTDSELLWEGHQNQSLLRRSKRVLGEHVELGSNSSTATSPSESRSGAKKRQDPKPKVEPSARRREQVLRAQRTHRQRTQTYIKTLEKEVLRLRKSEADATVNIDALQRTVYTLVHYLSENSIPFPPNFHYEGSQPFKQEISGPSQVGRIVIEGIDSQEPSINFEPVRSNVASKPSRIPTGPGTNRNSNLFHHEYHHHLHLHDLNQDPYQEVQSPATSIQPQGNEGHFSNYLGIPLQPSAVLSSNNRPSQRNNSSANISLPEDNAGTIAQDENSLLQDPRAAMDFILALEQPCMSHIRQSHLDYSSQDFSSTDDESLASGHVFMASMEYMPTIPHPTAQQTQQTHQLYPNLKQEPLSPVVQNRTPPADATPRMSTISHLNQHPNPSIDSNLHQSQPIIYDVTTADIERLLQYSLNIPLQGNEIAPVQVWKHLQKLPPSYKVNRAFLAELAVELRAYVDCLHSDPIPGQSKRKKRLTKCPSFGAVLDMSRVLEILGKYFPGYPHAEMMGL
ncbi:hypothetical protein B7463_g1377, partial [Scytalidium lignicola]